LFQFNLKTNTPIVVDKLIISSETKVFGFLQM